MADQGQLTIDKVVPALISQLGKLRNEYGELPQTVSSSATKVENAFMQWVGGANEAGGATNTLTGLLHGVANNIDQVATAAGALVAVGAARYLGNMALGASSATAGIINAAKSEVALAEARSEGRRFRQLARVLQFIVPSRHWQRRGVRDAQAAAEKRLSLAQESLNRNIQARVSAQTALNSVTAVGSRLMGSIKPRWQVFRGWFCLVPVPGTRCTRIRNRPDYPLRNMQTPLMQSVKRQNQCPCPKFLIMRPKPRQALEEQNRLVDAQASKVKSLKEEIAGYQYVLSNPGPTTSGGFMINHLTSVETVTRSLEEATSALAVELGEADSDAG